MRASRAVTSVVLAATAMVVLAGCAANPDVQGVQDGLEGLPGVNGADVSVQHPGAPWNTRIVVSMYLDDGSQAAAISAVEAAAPVLADAPEVSRHPVMITLVHGDIADFPTGPTRTDTILLNPDTYATLGLEHTGGESVQLTSDDIARLAGS